MNPNAMTRRGRRAAESLMTDTLRVTRKSDTPVTDPVTGKVTYPSVVMYEGRGRVQSDAPHDREVHVAGSSVDVATFIVQVPFDADVHEGDEAEVLASGSPNMVGRMFHIDAVPRKTHATMLRCGAEEVT